MSPEEQFIWAGLGMQKRRTYITPNGKTKTCRVKKWERKAAQEAYFESLKWLGMRRNGPRN
ncbi:uncharacterized protein EKO05_0007090 [Ascochyta rabiei]|nr:uncharacterized protein EKO05_0007090 [Ascochyta rabiei]UPX16702.1 hypothetical protein EKO05_0007090 [Ascochyta rabiei]